MAHLDKLKHAVIGFAAEATRSVWRMSAESAANLSFTAIRRLVCRDIRYTYRKGIL